jgi:hypothetical protein
VHVISHEQIMVLPIDNILYLFTDNIIPFDSHKGKSCSTGHVVGSDVDRELVTLIDKPEGRNMVLLLHQHRTTLHAPDCMLNLINLPHHYSAPP